MKKIILTTTVVAVLSLGLGCSKKDEPVQDKPVDKKEEVGPQAKLEITAVSLNTDKAVLGQRLIFKPALTDTTGKLNYLWQVYYGDTQAAETIPGQSDKSLIYNAEKTGPYTLKLTVTRGPSEKSSFEYKFNVVAAVFQYGVWGDSEQTIKNAESDHSNPIITEQVPIPLVEESVVLTTLTYLKAGRFYTYYFRFGKLYAGGYTQSVSYYNANTDLTGIYTAFFQEKDNLSKVLNTTIIEQKNWHTDITQDQIKLLDIDDLTRIRALATPAFFGFSAKASSKLGRATLNLYKPIASTVLLMSVLISPN